jgi:hypothetical protein
MSTEVASSAPTHDASAIVLFGPTLFLSAFLLFCFEPMVGKMMLPLLGERRRFGSRVFFSSS